MQLWLLDTEGSGERRQRRRKLAQSTILLATAIRWATSYRTSQEHVDQFMSCMQGYLNSLKELYPRMRFRPNHHASLHTGLFLLRFGPMPGWWMFPFERNIGILQKINTNYKLGKRSNVTCMFTSLTHSQPIGEIETTMLKSFCAAANFKALLQRTNNPVFADCAAVIQRATREGQPEARGTTRNYSAGVGQSCDLCASKKKLVPKCVRLALQDKHGQFCAEIPEWSLPTEAFFHRRFTVRDLAYSTGANSSRESTIFFQPSGSERIVPGIIREIFSVPARSKNGGAVCTESFFAIQVFQEYKQSNVGADPFSAHADFGACLWSAKMAEKLQIICTTQRVCHAAYRKWSKDVFVMKPLDKVSNPIDRVLSNLPF